MQSKLDALLIMAYNVGRDHERTQAMPVEEGRRVVLNVKKLFENHDPGDLGGPCPSIPREAEPA